MNKYMFRCFTFFLSTMMLTACTPSNDTVNNSEKNISVGYLAIAGALPLFVAQDQGFFKNNGINVEFVQFKSSNEVAIAAATGRIDVAGLSALNAMLDTMVTSNSSFKIFLSNGYVSGGDNRQSTDSLIVKKGIETLADLKGKKVAFFPGSISKVFADIVLEKEGLSMSDIEYIEMAPPSWLPSLQSGAIDAVTAVEPFATMIVQSGNGQVLLDGYYSSVFDGIPLSGAWFIEGSLTPELEERFAASLSKAIYFIKSDKENAVKSYENYTKMKPEVYNNIGLNEWTMVNEAGAQENLTKYLNILVEGKQTKFTQGNEWIWKAIN